MNTIQFPFTNYLVFPKVLEDEEICRGILELIFPDKKIGEIRLEGKSYSEEGDINIASEKTINISPNLRGVRMDVHIDSDKEWYNIEMQVYNDADLPKRMRLYQAEGDINSLKPGDEIKDLKRSFIIFICVYDPFGKDKALYNFRYRDLDDPTIVLEDETYKIVLNTKCKDVKIPIELKDFFDYINTMNVKKGDRLVERIHRSVEALNRGEWGQTMTTVGEFWDKRIKEACEEAYEKAYEEAVKKTSEETTLKTQLEIAKNMKRENISPDVIARATGLSLDEIAQIQE